MSATETHVEKSAVLSDDGLYRRLLTRVWLDWDGPRLCWVMLNPSTADAEVDDPTIRRCIGFSKAWGYHGLTVVNLFDLRATDPADLRDSAEAGVRPFSDQCDTYISAAVLSSDAVVAAWGTKGAYLKRDRAVTALITGTLGVDLLCLDVTKDGHPKHPLYIKGDTLPKPYVTRRRADLIEEAPRG